MTNNNEQLTMSASRQALLALGVIGVAGYLVSSTMHTLFDNNIGEFTGTLEAVPEELGTRGASINALVDFANSADTPIEFVNNSSTETNLTSRNNLLPNIEEFYSEQAAADDGPYVVTNVGFAIRNERIESSQIQILNELEQHAIQQSEQARNVLATTGISLNLLTGVADTNTNVLPEFVTYTNESDKAFTDRVAQVASRVAENQRLMSVLMSTPLAAPLTRMNRRTSGFGTRHDPITGETRFHAGVDMAAPTDTPVEVTASGRVIFAGWKDGYGNCIDVDHGNGFTTRYGHLNHIDVQVGQHVQTGHNIGRVGSTGHSTGPHLHYEVWYQGTVMDPRNFMIAGSQIHNRGV